MSKHNWGGYCPTHLYPLVNHDLKSGFVEWQYWFYTSWANHGRDNKMSGEFLNYENAYNWLVTRPDIILKMVLAHKYGLKYEFETDSSGTHQFDRNMRYVPRIVNIAIAHVQNPQMVNAIRTTDPEEQRRRSKINAEKHAVPIVTTDPYGNEVYWSSASEFAHYYGCNTGNVSQLLHGRVVKTPGATLYGWSIRKAQS